MTLSNVKPRYLFVFFFLVSHFHLINIFLAVTSKQTDSLCFRLSLNTNNPKNIVTFRILLVIHSLQNKSTNYDSS